MISILEARKIIQQHRLPLEIIEVHLKDAQGYTLAENIKADRPFPPFDRVTMDGIAIRFQEYQSHAVFNLKGIAAAGHPKKTLSAEAYSAIEVMTGAVLPNQADTVIRYEDLSIDEEQQTVSIKVDQLKKGQNVHQKALDRKKGEILVQKGQKLTAVEIGIAATVGKSTVQVYAKPKIAVLSTGDELVAIEASPLEHQIRRSNVWQIKALLESKGFYADLFHINDNEKEIKETLEKILSLYDVLVLSGGVSAGKYDFIPKILEALSIKKQFYKVAQRPGKPFWFGTGKGNKFVFALPGNPVSSFVCTVVYVLPWLENKAIQASMRVQLIEDFNFKKPLTLFQQARCTIDEQARMIAKVVTGNGSGDLASLQNCNGFIEFSDDKEQFYKGDILPFWQINDIS